MTRISAAIMAHPSRAILVDDLRSQLDRDVPVVWDEDERRPGLGGGDRIWAVARQAWIAYDPQADWHVLLQDDALVCRDFMAGLEKALEFVDDGALVSPFLGKGRNVGPRWSTLGRLADAISATWIRSYTPLWGVCLVASVRCIDEMVAWCDQQRRMPDDMRVGRWFQSQHRETWYTWPSLVDHHSVKDVPSLARGYKSERVALRFHEGSALRLPWGKLAVDDPEALRRRENRARRAGRTNARA